MSCYFCNTCQGWHYFESLVVTGTVLCSGWPGFQSQLLILQIVIFIHCFLCLPVSLQVKVLRNVMTFHRPFPDNNNGLCRWSFIVGISSLYLVFSSAEASPPDFQL